MVYCNLLGHEKESVTYAFGNTPDDITGRLRFNYKKATVEIEKEPDVEMPLVRHIYSLLRKHQGEFMAGEFKKKLAYEI